MKTTFYTACDAPFFVGVVSLVNSLALTGNHQEVVVFDLGLTDDQRRFLSSSATLIIPPEHLIPSHPYLVKPLITKLHETDVAVWIDSDMMVTASLEPLVARAAEGAICVFPDPEVDRWFLEWESDLSLRSPLRRQPYVNAGFFALATPRWSGFLGRWDELCQSIPLDRTVIRGAPKDDPLFASDQDALNALLMSEVAAESLEIRHPNEEVHCHAQPHARIIDGQKLAVEYRSVPVTLLHQALLPKPWQRQGWKILDSGNPYVRLIPRVLFAEDVRLRLAVDQVPRWLRPSRRETALRGATLAARCYRGLYRFVFFSVYYRMSPRARAPIRTCVRRVMRLWQASRR
jgi:hypothetical protein